MTIPKNMTIAPLAFSMSGWFPDNWITGAGVPLVNADNGRAGLATEATFDGPEALEIYTILDEMMDAGLISAFSATPGQINHILAAASGEASMFFEVSFAATSIAAVLGGTADLSELKAGTGIEGTVDLSLNIDVAEFPGLRAPGQVYVSGAAYYMTNTGSDAEQAATWEFMKFLNSTESQKVIHLKGGFLPTNPEVLSDPEVQDIWADDAAGQWLATAYDQYARIDPEFSGAAIGPFTEQRLIMRDSLEAMLLEGEDPAAVLDEASTRLTEVLQQYADQDF